MYSQCSTYDGNNDLHDAPTRSYCSVAPRVKQAAFSSCMDAGVGHASATCQLWRSRRRASQVASFGVWNSDMTGCTITYFITYVVCLYLHPTCPSPLSVHPQNAILYIRTYYIAIIHPDKQRNIYMSSVPGTCHRSCPGIIRPFFAMLFLGLKCHYHTQLAE